MTCAFGVPSSGARVNRENGELARGFVFVAGLS
jgi:hypothetical protein